MTKGIGNTARGAALGLLSAVLDRGIMLSDARADAAQPYTRLADPADRARALRLTLSVLRALGPLDKSLAPCLQKPPAPAVQHILRLALWELAQEGAAAHGIVNEAVAMARASERTARQAGLVNAVLRRLAGPPAPRLVGENRLPNWLRQPLVDHYSRRRVEAMERVWSRPPPIDLTLKGEGAPLPEGGTRLPNGSVRLAPGTGVTSLPGFAEGQFWVQDAAAAMAVPMLGDLRGKRVLDLCAAPGGKTMQLAAAGARVTALDLSAPRMTRLKENLTRTGLAAEIVIADALTWQPQAPFDAILLDAPCSATGTIRRHPDLPHVRLPETPQMLADLQARLLDRALGWLSPGGRLVYATCSLLPQEGEAQIAAALARHAGLSVIPPALPWVPADWITAEGGLRLCPDHWGPLGGMDGFFIACLGRG